MARALRIPIDEQHGEVSALLERPSSAHGLLLLAHGAGADMRHSFMQAIAEALASRGVATLRYQFPYTEAGQRRPNSRATLLAAVTAAAALARECAEGLPLFAGGKSMGGRMTSQCAAESGASDAGARASAESGARGSAASGTSPTPGSSAPGEGRPLAGFRGLVFVGFPLHAAGKPASRERAEHLFSLDLPQLFLQGTRDKLAPLDEIEPLCRDLGARARLHIVAGADHGFQVLKRSGRSDAEVMEELADAIDAFVRDIATHARQAAGRAGKGPCSMIEINGMAHAFVTVADFARSRAFYSQLLPFLGLKPVLDGDGIYYCVGGRTAFGLRPAENAEDRFDQGRVGLHHLCFRVREREHVDRVHDKVVELGATIVHAPEDGSFAPGYYSVLFEDPDGIRLEVNFVPGRGLLEGKS